MTAIDSAYKDLLLEGLPRAVHSEREYRKCVARIEGLLDGKRSAAEDRYLELLAVLVERYEEEQTLSE